MTHSLDISAKVQRWGLDAASSLSERAVSRDMINFHNEPKFRTANYEETLNQTIRLGMRCQAVTWRALWWI